MKKSAGCLRKQKLKHQIRLDPIRSKTGMNKAPSNKFSKTLELPAQRRFVCHMFVWISFFPSKTLINCLAFYGEGGSSMEN
ncbi:hypothetical protein MTR67_013321 [Solanum verrucosum]|uniref:Uncharacterized protein n=1 Tax=Solanum verrucosum TaxID=315347 RepID=A0AAF0QB08_SOLVR|nr:hypothetical protein MTR67_013321 [Solanum verrucosum]